MEQLHFMLKKVRLNAYLKKQEIIQQLFNQGLESSKKISSLQLKIKMRKLKLTYRCQQLRKMEPKTSSNRIFPSNFSKASHRTKKYKNQNILREENSRIRTIQICEIIFSKVINQIDYLWPLIQIFCYLLQMRNQKEFEMLQSVQQNCKMSQEQLKKPYNDITEKEEKAQQKKVQNSLNFQQNKTIFSEKPSFNDKTKQEEWKQSQIKNIFKLYAEYGSQWKIIQTQFPDRSSNSIKNRFYTVVRTFLKILFRQHPSIQNKLPHQIASKIILKFYEGRQEFIKFKGFGKKIMKAINYDIESKLLPKLVLENAEDIEVLYNLVFPQVLNEKPKKKKSKTTAINPTQPVEQKQGTIQIQNKLLLQKTDTSYHAGQNNYEKIGQYGENQMYEMGVAYEERVYEPNYFVFPSLSFFSVVNYPFFSGV